MRRVPKAEIIAEDYNYNIRRYVDNAPPPEPHDVRAHLHGGVPKVEVARLAHFWQNYTGLQPDAFVPRDDVYLDFAPAIAQKRDIADFVATHSSTIASHQQFMHTLAAWWQDNLPVVKALAPDEADLEGRNSRDATRTRNVYLMRSSLLKSIEQALSQQQLLTPFQVRGAFANYVDLLKADFKSIAAGLSPLAPDRELFAASRLFLREIENRIEQRENFAFETTLSGRSYLKLVRRLRAEDWRVELIYLALPNIETSRLRVAERVAHGGHNILLEDIERRFPRSLANLLDVFNIEVDICRCFLNTNSVPELVFEQRGELCNIVHADYYQYLISLKEAMS